ncbi:MAG TPA: hypothetical protein VF815_08475, partial [Myxococcaceae bacterium]
MKRSALILVCTALALMGLELFIPPAHASNASSKNMQQFMEKDLNPAFTDVSYLLFQVRKPGEKPNAELRSAFERLLERTSQLKLHPRSQGEQGASFRNHAVQLHTAVRGLADASQSGDEAQ